MASVWASVGKLSGSSSHPDCRKNWVDAELLRSCSLPINRRRLVTALTVSTSAFFGSYQFGDFSVLSLPAAEASGLFLMPPLRLVNR